MDPIFGWGSVCRFSWDTTKKMLEAHSHAPKVDWPVEGEDDSTKITNFLMTTNDKEIEPGEIDELSGWFGRRITETIF